MGKADDPSALSRRSLVEAGAAAVVASGCRWPEPAPTPAPSGPLTSDQGQTLQAAVSRLLPGSDRLPGAEAAQVPAAILQSLGDDALKGIADEIGRGLDHLDAAARAEHGGPFATRGAAAQDALLTAFQTGEIRIERFQTARFFELLLTLALEGYLGHPRHGGNPDGIVWKALELGWQP